MVARSEIYWAHLDEPRGRRPVCVLTRDPAASYLTSVTCALITSTIRGKEFEVEVGRDEGLRGACVVNCDSLVTFETSRLDPRPVGHLGMEKQYELDQALRFALGIRY